MSIDSLVAEGKYIHRLLFGFNATEDLVANYIQVHSVYAKYIEEKSQKLVSDLISRRVDLVSLEFFWRLKNKKNLLSQKFQIIFYLTEVRPEYQTIYLSQRNDSFAFFKLVGMTLKSVFRLIKGYWIYSRL